MVSVGSIVTFEETIYFDRF